MADDDHDRDSWQRVDRLFAAALDRPPAERLPFLESETGGNQSLLEELNSFIVSHRDELDAILADYNVPRADRRRRAAREAR